MEDKIDIYRRDVYYEKTLQRIEADMAMLKRNKELLLKFIWDCRLGKTIKGRAKKKIGKVRVLKYMCLLKNLSDWLGKPFDKATKEDMEKLVNDIENDTYKKKNRDNYSEESKVDYKKALRKFYKWLGKERLVEFMDTSVTMKEVPALTRDEVEALVDSTPDKMIKAVLMVLFDGGLRAAEFLNVRIKDLAKKDYRSDSDCYWINIRYSKTFSRTIPLPLCTKHLSEWLAIHPRRDDQEALLITTSYPALIKRVKILANKVLKKNINLHTLRHSSATYWAPKMNRYQLCAKYGWAFSSDMPDRYIKRKGIIFDEIAEKGDVDKTTKLQKENMKLKEQVERLEHDYRRFSKALEFMMPIVLEKFDDKEFESTQLERAKRRLLMN